MGNCCQVSNNMEQTNLESIKFESQFKNAIELENYLKSDIANIFAQKYYAQLETIVVDQIAIREVTNQENDISISDFLIVSKSMFQTINIWYRQINDLNFTQFWNKYQEKIMILINEYSKQQQVLMLFEKVENFQHILEIIYLVYQVLHSLRAGDQNIWWGDYKQLQFKINNLIQQSFFTANFQTQEGLNVLNNIYIKSYLILKSKFDDSVDIQQLKIKKTSTDFKYSILKNEQSQQKTSFQMNDQQFNQQSSQEKEFQDNFSQNNQIQSSQLKQQQNQEINSFLINEQQSNQHYQNNNDQNQQLNKQINYQNGKQDEEYNSNKKHYQQINNI